MRKMFTRQDVYKKRSIMAIVLIFSLILPILSLCSFASFPDEAEVKIVGENEELRKVNEKHFVCSDGSMLAVSYPTDVHYLDGDGLYKDIDNSLTYDSITKQYENKGNKQFSVALSKTGNSAPVSLKANGKYEISFSTQLAYANSDANFNLKKASVVVDSGSKVSANKIIGSKAESADFVLKNLESGMKYKNAYSTISGVSAEYNIIGNALKENIILEEMADVTAFVTIYNTSDLTLTVCDDGSLVFSDSDGKGVYYVAPAYMYDDKGEACADIKVRSTKTENGYAVAYIPQKGWLTDSERSYPVVFDPTVTTTSTASTADIGYYSASQTGYTNEESVSSSGTLKVGNLYQRIIYYAYYRPTKYPSINTKYYDVNSVQIRFKIKTDLSTGSYNTLYSYALSSPNDPSAFDYYEMYNKGTLQQSNENGYLYFSASKEYYENGNYPVNIIYPNSYMVSNPVELYGMSGFNTRNWPALIVSYTLKDHNEKVFTISNTYIDSNGNESIKYLSVENGVPVASETPMLWQLSGSGDYYRISCFGDDEKILSAGNGLSLENVGAAGNYGNWALNTSDGKIYTFTNQQTGVGLFYNANSDTLGTDTGLSSSTSQRAWDLNFILNYSPASYAILQNRETIEEDLNSLPNDSTDETQVYKFVKIDSRCFKIVSSDNTKMLATSSTGGLTSINNQSGDYKAKGAMWYLIFDQSSAAYYIMNAKNGMYLHMSSSTLDLSKQKSNASLWNIKDFYELSLQPGTKSEFALKDMSTELYAEYSNVYATCMNVGMNTLNLVIDETKAEQSNNKTTYKTFTRDVCQRFTFEEVEVTGEKTYYQILPFLKATEDDVKGAYNSDYRLEENNWNVTIEKYWVRGEDDEPYDINVSYWELIDVSGGFGYYYIRNKASGRYLSQSGNVLVTSSFPTVWNIMAIGLAVEKDYQRTDKTCGAACGLMMYNYVFPNDKIQSESEYIRLTNAYMDKYYKNTYGKEYGGKYYVIIGTHQYYINYIYKTKYNKAPYTSDWDDDRPGNTFNVVLKKSSGSLNSEYPVLFWQRLGERTTAEIADPIWGHHAPSHYILLKGIYFDSYSDEYKAVVNDPHYMFGPIELNGNPAYNLGGRDVIVSFDHFYSVIDVSFIYHSVS